MRYHMHMHSQRNRTTELTARSLNRATGNWREAQSKMAAAGWVMEPFIQLTYNDQCPLKTSQLTETSFVDRRKVTEHFWFDLLERKCPEGVYNVFVMFVLVQLEWCCKRSALIFWAYRFCKTEIWYGV